MNERKNQIQRIKDGETGPGNAKRGQPLGQPPVTGPKETVDLTTLPSSANTGHGNQDQGER
jgi:hypothetical protein